MGGYRDSAEYDKKFMKVLLTACNGAERVKAGQLDAFVIEFIEG